MERQVKDVHELNRTPLFENAPFLRLRPGDRLVKAKEKIEPGSMPPANPDEELYFLHANGKYYQLWAFEKNGELLLSAAFHAAEYCLLFDWELTMPNAQALRQLLPLEYSSSLSEQQFEQISNSVIKEFPDAVSSVEGNSRLEQDRLISIPGHALAEFQGLADSHLFNCVYKYTLRIGPDVFLIVGETLLRGPNRVERREFEPPPPGNFIVNQSPVSKINPATAKIKRAEYKRMLRFQTLVEQVIKPPPPAREVRD